VPAARLLRVFGGRLFSDRGSWHNGRPVDLLAAARAHPGAEISAEVGWQPPYRTALDAPADVAARVRAGAGAGRLAWADAHSAAVGTQ
jgi:pectate lyase